MGQQGGGGVVWTWRDDIDRPGQTEKTSTSHVGLVDLNFYSPTKKFTRPQVLSVIKTILKFKI